MLVICESADASKLTGLGGVGKTLTATWYANNYKNEYDHVIWIDCGEGSLLTSFQKLARDLDVKHLDKLLDLEDYSRKTYEVLEEFKCLLVFDNAESYKGEDGIKEVLPKGKDNFYCLITSRWREWGIANIGYGQISRLELNIFGESESLEFFKQNLQQDIKYTEYQLKELCRLLGNLPLAMQLAVAALNTRNIDLKNYIEKTSTKDLKNIVDTKFDDYEKTINGSVNITLEIIGKEEGGIFAKEILNVFGYIPPDNIEKDFLTRILSAHSDENILRMNKAMKLLTKYLLITQDKSMDTKFDGPVKIFFSIHRLLQQVIRHNGRKTEKDTLRKILGCKGFLEYKLLPFTKYADDELKKEFPKLKAELLDQQQLLRLVNTNRFDAAVELAKFIDNELQKHVTKFNYAICLEKNGQLEESVQVLEKLYKLEITDGMNYLGDNAEMGLLNLKKRVTKELIGGHLLVYHWKMGNIERLQKILEERKCFKMIPSQELTTTLLRILNSNLIQSKYSLTIQGSIFILLLDGDTKKITLFDYIVDLDIPLPNDLQELFLRSVDFKQEKSKYMNTIDLREWLPKKLITLELDLYSWMPNKKIILSLESISSIENISLCGCSLNLDSVNRISPRTLKLEDISYFKNGQELSNVHIHKLIDFHKINRLELKSHGEKNVSIDLSEESANMEYLQLDDVNVLSLKSADGNGRVNIKEAEIQACSLDLSILPSSLEKLSLSYIKQLFVGEGIELPNLKYLKLEWVDISYLYYFRSIQLTYLYLRKVEIDVNILPKNAKIIRIDKKCSKARPVVGVINLDKLIVGGLHLNEVEKMLPHFHPKILVLYYGRYKPRDLIQLMQKKHCETIAIGKIGWGNEDFKNSIFSKQIDRKSEYYLFHKNTVKAIEWKEFNELYLLKDIFGR